MYIGHNTDPNFFFLSPAATFWLLSRSNSQYAVRKIFTTVCRQQKKIFFFVYIIYKARTIVFEKFNRAIVYMYKGLVFKFMSR